MEIETYLIWLCAGVLVLCLFGILRLMQRKKASVGQTAFLATSLNKALEQQATVDLKLSQDSSRAGLVTKISSLKPGSLMLKAPSSVSEEWKNAPVEGYFQIEQDGSPVFLVFESTLRNISEAGEEFILDVQMPKTLRVEMKRHFPRVRPGKSSALMIAIWPVAPGRRLPRENGELGPPAMSWRAGQQDQNLAIENISASGIALGLTGKLDFDIVKGRQIAGLVVYRTDTQSEKVIFLFTGEIMNCRQAGEKTAIGLEFTNWAVQKPGDTEIHWSHSSPWRGVKPVHQWVEQIKRSSMNSDHKQ